MKNITPAEFLMINKVIEELYNPEHSLPARLIGFLNTFTKLVYYDRAAILFFYRNADGSYKRHSSFATNWEHIKVPVERYYEYYHLIDDTLPVFDQPSPIIFRSSEFFNQDIRQKTEYWTNYLKPNNCVFSIEGNLSLKNTQNLHGGFCFFRGAEKKDFSERDLEVTSYMQPHLSNVLKYYGNTINSTSITFLLDNHNCIGTAMLDENCDIVKSNFTFQNMISDQEFGSQIMNRIRTIALKLKTSSESSIEYKFDDKPIMLEISSMPADAESKSEQYCCIIYNLSYFFTTSLNQAKEKYQLTNKEFNIVQELINGKSNEEIATQFFISVPTVKKHLASIYSKMEIKNQKQIFDKLNIK